MLMHAFDNETNFKMETNFKVIYTQIKKVENKNEMNN